MTKRINENEKKRKGHGKINWWAMSLISKKTTCRTRQYSKLDAIENIFGRKIALDFII